MYDGMIKRYGVGSYREAQPRPLPVRKASPEPVTYYNGRRVSRDDAAALNRGEAIADTPPTLGAWAVAGRMPLAVAMAHAAQLYESRQPTCRACDLSPEPKPYVERTRAEIQADCAARAATVADLKRQGLTWAEARRASGLPTGTFSRYWKAAQ